jgi:hypothetical protein
MAHNDHEKTFLEDDTGFLSRIARFYALDAIRCEMHNEGYAIDGNTEETDTSWFARLFYEAQPGFHRRHWDNLSEEERERHITEAKLIISLIPRLMARMSARCIRISEAVNTIIKAEKLDEYYRQAQKHPMQKRGL